MWSEILTHLGSVVQHLPEGLIGDLSTGLVLDPGVYRRQKVHHHWATWEVLQTQPETRRGNEDELTDKSLYI